jgi:hypothetical protein
MFVTDFGGSVYRGKPCTRRGATLAKEPSLCNDVLSFTRQSFLFTSVALGATAALKMPPPDVAQENTAIRPFSVNVDEAEIVELRRSEPPRSLSSITEFTKAVTSQRGSSRNSFRKRFARRSDRTKRVSVSRLAEEER